MKKFLFPLLLLAIITLPTILPFFNSRFFYTQDYIFIARLQQLSSAFFSGQFPVRWAPDLRYGEPVFNFYADFPYYIGAFIHLLGFNIIWSSKILFIIAAFFSACAMYLLGKELFGKKGGYLSAVLYTYAPYRAVDMYVRGSLSETWAFVFFPLIFLASLLLSKKQNYKSFFFLALSLAGLFLTHNVTTLMFLPFLFLWWAYLLLKEKKLKIFISLFLASILSLGISAFFLLPAFFEREFIQTKYLIVGYFNFRAHFVAFKQFFSLFWGYGSSVWGPNDGLSFQVGLVNYAILFITAILAVLKRKNRKFLMFFIFLATSFVLSIFLQHNKSAFIWEALPLMAFIQFPWRFLGISIFIAALAGGFITPYLSKFKLYYLIIALAILSTIFYFKPKEYTNDSFFEKFLNIQMMHKGIDLTKDYLPIWVQTVDGERFDEPRSEKGEIAIADIKKSSTSMQFFVHVATESAIELPITYFPGWEVTANNKLVPRKEPSKMGLIRFDLSKGDYNVTAGFKNTSIRTLGNILSIISVLLIVFVVLFKKLRKV